LNEPPRTTSGDRTRSAPHLRSSASRFPRSEPQASGEIHQAGFTLIEMLAVIAMFGLIAAMVLPNIDLGGSRVARGEAQDLAAAIEFARQRAVMTGRTHQVVIEVDRGQHWVEWAAPPHREEGDSLVVDASNFDALWNAPEPDPASGHTGPDGEQKLELVPPPLETEAFVPIPGELGRVHTAGDKVAILGVEISGGLAERGRVELRITPDGAADPTSILVGDADGSHPVRVEVEPLADAVRVFDVQ
jgi:prepilin-type N-terminal cleavage/methylation domain-containing protein